MKLAVCFIMILLLSGVASALTLSPTGEVYSPFIPIVCNGDSSYFEIYVDHALVQNSSLNTYNAELAGGNHTIACAGSSGWIQNDLEVIIPYCNGKLISTASGIYCITCTSGFTWEVNKCVPDEVGFNTSKTPSGVFNLLIYRISPENPLLGLVALIIMIGGIIIIWDTERKRRN